MYARTRTFIRYAIDVGKCIYAHMFVCVKLHWCKLIFFVSHRRFNWTDLYPADLETRALVDQVYFLAQVHRRTYINLETYTRVVIRCIHRQRYTRIHACIHTHVRTRAHTHMRLRRNHTQTNTRIVPPLASPEHTGHFARSLCAAGPPRHKAIRRHHSQKHSLRKEGDGRARVSLS